MEQCSDNELIARLRQGENPALNEIMRRYKHRLYAFVLRYVHNEETAYDLVQETFTKLYFSADKFNPQYKFSTWLFQIALNLCRDYWRKNGREHHVSLDEEIGEDLVLGDTLASDAPPTDKVVDTKRQLAWVESEISRLPHKLKSALIAFAVEERSQEECAELLGITPKTLETRVYRARKILTEKLSKKK